MLIVRILAQGIFHHYIYVMHIHRSIICSSTQRIILAPITLIRTSFRSSRSEISILPNRKIHVAINKHKLLSPNSRKVVRLHTVLSTIHVNTGHITITGLLNQYMIILDMIMTSTFPWQVIP